jgi:hypothetical protein
LKATEFLAIQKNGNVGRNHQPLPPATSMPKAQKGYQQIQQKYCAIQILAILAYGSTDKAGRKLPPGMSKELICNKCKDNYKK